MIKGSVLTDQGLRGNHTSVDVDVLVDPAVYDDYLASLRHAGWDVKIESTVAGAAERHATTVYHQAWPITIDVHRRFPGFLADPRVVFEALWQHRTEATVAHTQVTTLDPVAHAALQALHYLRSPTSGLAMLYLPDLIERTPEALGAAGLVELSDFAGRVGAAQTLADFLDQVGAPAPSGVSGQIDEASLRGWKLGQTAVPSTNWVWGIFGRPPAQWPRAIRQAVMLTDAEIDSTYRREGESRLRARIRRVGKGLRNLPGALKAVLAYKLTHRKERQQSGDRQ